MRSRASVLPVVLAVAAACQPGELPGPPPPPDVATPPSFPLELDRALHAACPAAALDDEQALHDCAEALADLPELRARMIEPFEWGAQATPAERAFAANNRTDFNPRVWRRLYLATFMFPGGHSVEQDGDTTIVRIPVQFRVNLDPGAFPYPFWHSPDKWNSYETARELLFYLRGGKLIGALRSAERDHSRPQRPMNWDGRWTWETGRGAEPRVTLFSYVFSPDNPHVGELDRRYRALEKQLRKENCLACHSPDNTAKMNPLELFSYPNQALSGRHDLVRVMELGTMPPPPAPGIVDPARRAEIARLARAFADTGDAALAFEDTRP